MNPPPQSPALWLSLATGPFLVGLLAARSLMATLMEVSQASEEIFRGDRLPTLNISESEGEEVDSL